MNDLNTTTSTDQPATEPSGFQPAYEVSESTRIYRRRLHDEGGGLATATFLGQISDATTCWVKRGSHGISLYAEVSVDDTSATTVTVAVVPTGKRVPEVDGARSLRLGSVGGQHVYLIAVDGTIDRTAYLADREARAKAAQAQRILLDADLDDDGDDDGYRLPTVPPHGTNPGIMDA